MVESGREKVAGQSYLSIFFFKDVLIYLKEQQQQREKGMEGERD